MSFAPSPSAEKLIVQNIPEILTMEAGERMLRLRSARQMFNW